MTGTISGAGSAYLSGAVRVTRLTRHVPLVEKDLLIFPEHPRFLVGFVLLDLSLSV